MPLAQQVRSERGTRRLPSDYSERRGARSGPRPKRNKMAIASKEPGQLPAGQVQARTHPSPHDEGLAGTCGQNPTGVPLVNEATDSCVASPDAHRIPALDGVDQDRHAGSADFGADARTSYPPEHLAFAQWLLRRALHQWNR